jgi:plasmid maintenance system antidote protein VapI
MSKSAAPVSDALRQALRAAPSRYAVARATGVAQSVLSRFVHGKAGLDLGTADKLAAHFGLELRPKFKTMKRNEVQP